MTNEHPLRALHAYGQSFWLDNLSRAMIDSGDLDRRIEQQGLRGITSNPAIFRKAIADSDDYDDQIDELASEGVSDPPTAFEHLAVRDVQAACDRFAPLHEASGGDDGYVSLEVSPHLAHDTAGTLEEVRRLWTLVDRPNAFIKIPGTPAGTPAVEEALYEGVNVNITLLFSIGAYEAVADAYMRALERRLDEGRDVGAVRSVASFFLSRIDTLVDRLLEHRVSGERRAGRESRLDGLRGATAIANAKLAYQSLQDMLTGDRWRRLAAAGAHVQRLLWASTSTKNPAYSEVHYVEPLIGPHTVSTMPDRTAEAFARNGRVTTTVEGGVDGARRVLADVDELGIDFDCVTRQLLDEGVQKFIEPYDALMETLAERLAPEPEGVTR